MTLVDQVKEGTVSNWLTDEQKRRAGSSIVIQTSDPSRPPTNSKERNTLRLKHLSNQPFRVEDMTEGQHGKIPTRMLVVHRPTGMLFVAKSAQVWPAIPANTTSFITIKNTTEGLEVSSLFDSHIFTTTYIVPTEDSYIRISKLVYSHAEF